MGIFRGAPLPPLFFLFLVLTGVSLKVGSVGAVNCVEPSPNSLVSHTLNSGGVAWSCTSPESHIWNTGDRVIASSCQDQNMIESDFVCEEADQTGGSTSEPTCDEAQKPVIENASDQVINNIAVHYTCDNNLAWLSGMKGRFSQCIKGAWSRVLDVCDEACNLPRDCSMVFDLGLYEPGTYQVITSGEERGSMSNVSCEEEGWTNILQIKEFASEPSDYSHENGTIGWVDESSENVYFIGTERLYHLTVEVPIAEASQRPLVLRIILEDSDGKKFFADYDNFLVNNEGTLTSVGKYHGNAGDALSSSVNASFSGQLWWECSAGASCSSVSWDSITWGPLGNTVTTISKIQVMARPKALDERFSCPVKFPFPPKYAEGTEYEMTLSRSVDSTLNYSCGPNMVEPSQLHTGNTVTCVNNSGTLDWDYVPQLPCVLNCPPTYVKTPDEKSCILVISDVATNGIHSASKACAEKQGTLLLLKEADHINYLQTADPERYYFTGHAFIDSAFSPDPMVALGSGKCSEDCEGSTDLPCLAVKGRDANGDVHFKAIICNDTTTSYICQWPVTCPPNFTPFEGHCYQAVNTYSPLESFVKALDHCATLGSALAYPENYTAFEFLKTLVESHQEFPQQGEVDVIIGINDMYGDFTADGKYNPYPDVVSFAGTSGTGTNYRLLRMSESTPRTLTLEPDKLVSTSTNVKFAICQLHGTQGCWTDPPATPDNSYSGWDGAIAISSIIPFTCYPGYFAKENLTKQEVECLGLLGGWQTKDDPTVQLEGCNPTDVCKSFPESPSEHITVTNSTNPLHMNGTANFTCPANMVTANLNTTQTITCTKPDPAADDYAFDPDTVEACNVCLGKPEVQLAITEHNPATNYSVSDTLTVTCDTGYEVSFEKNTYTIMCNETGWDPPNTCHKVCIDNPAAAGAAMTRGEYTTNTLGTKVNYTCDPGLFVLLSGSTTLVNFTEVTCIDMGTGNWTTVDQMPDCLHYCQEGPTLVNSDSEWSNTAHYKDGDIITASCNEGYAIDLTTTTQNLTCSTEGWTPEPTPCHKACMSDPPAASENMTMTGLTTNKVNTTLTYTCETDMLFILDPDEVPISSTTVTCLDSGEWSPIITFNPCGPETSDPPPFDNSTMVLSGKDGPFAPGSEQTLTCARDTVSFTGASSTVVTYDGANWIKKDPAFDCFHIATEPPPVGKTNLKPLSPYALEYGVTAAHLWPSPLANMSDPAGNDNNIITVQGPTGFGNAISLDPLEKQCRYQSGYTTIDDCSANPAHCDQGFSISVWYKSYYKSTVDTYITEKTGKMQTIFSTGGDTEGHPGVHAYLEDDLMLNVVVSNGTHFWISKLSGVFFEDSWTNLGARWSADLGLEVYLKHTNRKIADKYSDFKPKARTPSPDPVPEGTAKKPLDPPEMILGCHKDADDTKYRHYAEGALDELTTWTQVIADPVMFLGGYSEELGEEGLDSLMMTADVANLQDAETAVTMVNSLNSVSKANDEGADDGGVAPTSSPTSATSGTQASPTATASAAPPAGQESFKGMLEMMSKVTSTVPNNVKISNIERLANVVKIASNMLGSKYTDNFHAELQETDNAGAAGMLGGVQLYVSNMLAQVELTANQSRDGYTISKDSRNIKLMGWKRNLGELRDEGEDKKYWQFPKCDQLHRDPLWSHECSRVAVSHEVIPWDECKNWTVSAVITAERTYHTVAPTQYNMAHLKRALPKMLDSRTLSVHLDVQPPEGYEPAEEENSDVVSFTSTNKDGEAVMKDRRKSPCHPTQESLMNTPVRLKLFHLNKNMLFRKMLFHEELERRQIMARHCVFWNKDLGDYGEWDTSGCKITETNQMYTKCSCARLGGTFAVLTETVEPKTVPAEEVWLTMMRYAGYILSFFFIILYIVVVVISKDLRDMFHLMGLNLAVAVFLGALSMLLSDIHAVRDDRHSCTAVGTLIHVFYQAAGAWIFSLGHAAFDAITSGVIGGRLRSYMALSWGLPLISMGSTYVFYMLQLGDDPRCFISWENPAKMIFFGFQMVFVFFSCLCGIVVLCNMATPALRKDNLVDDYGSFCRGAAFLMLFFDLTWIFALLCYLRLSFEEPDFYPIFQVLNSCTGIILFLFIGLGSRRFRMVIAGQTKMRREMLKNYAFGKPRKTPQDKQTLSSPLKERPRSTPIDNIHQRSQALGRRPLSAD